LSGRGYNLFHQLPDAKAVEMKETRTAGEVSVSSRNRLLKATFVPSDKQWRKARKETTYLTFVPYLAL
jgi:hypothetical protein